MIHDLLPPHGICLLADPGLLWGMVIGNAIIAISYFVIPWSLRGLAVRQSRESRARTKLIQAFVIACGVTHVMMVLVVFVGGWAYYAQLGATFFAAVISALTAAAFARARRHMLP